MVQHKNFYETVKEAEMRLLHTAVLYDNEPYVVLAITNHKPDGIFRVYLDPFPVDHNKTMWSQQNHVPYDWCDEPNMTRGQKLDEYLEQYASKGCPLLRKRINSPLFNKFRPFELGMCNVGNNVYYLARSPVRHTQQGLMDGAISQHKITIGDHNPFVPQKGPRAVSFYGASMRDVIKGVYPTIEETVEAFRDPTVTNEAVGFNRNFAIVKGPMRILFLAYKHDIVGYLPDGSLNKVIIGKEFKHTKEVVSELGAFQNVVVQ